MGDTLKIKIRYDDQARDGIEIKKRQDDIFDVRISKEVDLRDEELAEVFVDKFNVAHAGMDSSKEPILNVDDRLHRVELLRLQEAMQSGREKYSFRLHSH